ncbi:MAG: hypothetical protein NZ455_05225 [Bacteroidia bacterium]|nr:hypothetical protein [Bacteroidia bacterium]
MGVSLRCASGRRAAGCAIAAVASLRFALLTHPPHASRSSILMFYFIFIHIFALPCLILIIKYLQS